MKYRSTLPPHTPSYDAVNVEKWHAAGAPFHVPSQQLRVEDRTSSLRPLFPEMSEIHHTRQDEAGLPPATVASTLSALAATSKSIGDRRIAAITSSTMRVRSEAPSSEGSGKNGGIGSAVTALQDCLIHARRAVLATTGAALRVRKQEHHDQRGCEASLAYLHCTSILGYIARARTLSDQRRARRQVRTRSLPR